MLDFFELGELLLDGMDSLYDFFFNSPVTLREGFYEFLQPVYDFFGWDGLEPVYVISSGVGATPSSLVYYIFGGGLVFILVYKFIKFFVDLVL